MFLMEPKELGATHATQVTEFVGELLPEFNTASGNVRVGLLTSHCGGGNVELQEFRDELEMAAAFQSTPMSTLAPMVRQLRTHSYKEENGGRDAARHMAVIFVDDALFDPEAVLKEARRSRHHDVEIFVVAIGDSVVEAEVAALCSEPTDRHIIRVPSYDALKSSKDTFLQHFCHGL